MVSTESKNFESESPSANTKLTDHNGNLITASENAAPDNAKLVITGFNTSTNTPITASVVAEMITGVVAADKATPVSTDLGIASLETDSPFVVDNGIGKDTSVIANTSTINKSPFVFNTGTDSPVVVNTSTDEATNHGIAIGNSNPPFIADKGTNKQDSVPGYSTVDRPNSNKQATIEAVRAGQDAIFCNWPRSGTTTDVLKAISQRIEPNLKATQILIITPLRELAVNTAALLKSLQIPPNRRITVHKSIGGVSELSDIRRLYYQPEVVIGTSGRLNRWLNSWDKSFQNLPERPFRRPLDVLINDKDRLDASPLKLKNLKVVVLDGCDSLLNPVIPHDGRNRSFEAQVCEILYRVPRDVQIILTSTSLVRKKAMLSLVRKEAYFFLGRTDIPAAIKQYQIQAEHKDKLGLLIPMLQRPLLCPKILILTHSTSSVDGLSRELKKWMSSNRPVLAYHMKMWSNPNVTEWMAHWSVEWLELKREFEESNNAVLVTTFELASAINADNTLIINFNVPGKEHYGNVIGRLGVAGRVLNLVSRKERQLMDDIQEDYSTTVNIISSIDDVM